MTEDQSKLFETEQPLQPWQRWSPAERLNALEPERAFDGHTYVPEVDYARLGHQARRVFDLMADGGWRTLREISDATGDPEASVSARLRDLRKDKFGGLVVRRRRRGAAELGLFEYRLDRDES